MTLECPANFIFRLQHCLLAELRIASGPQTLREIHSKLDLLLREAGAKGADIRVEGEKLRSFHAVEGDALQHVRARSTEADDLDCGGRDGFAGVAGIRNHCWEYGWIYLAAEGPEKSEQPS